MWHLSAAGALVDAEAEAELHEKLAGLLHNPAYGLVTSHFSSDSHNGPLPKPKAARKK